MVESKFCPWKPIVQRVCRLTPCAQVSRAFEWTEWIKKDGANAVSCRILNFNYAYYSNPKLRKTLFTYSVQRPRVKQGKQTHYLFRAAAENLIFNILASLNAHLWGAVFDLLFTQQQLYSTFQMLLNYFWIHSIHSCHAWS